MTETDRYGALALATLLVAAAVVAGIGPYLVGSAEAQTDVQTKQFTTGPHKVEIGLKNVSTDVTVAVRTDESPAGNNTTILRKTVSASEPSAHFRNAGAYGTFTVRVEGTTNATFSKGGVASAWTPGDSGKFLGDTGGDAGFSYDLTEQLSESVVPEVVQLDRTGLPGSTKPDTSDLDTAQGKLDTYQSVQSSKAHAAAYHATLYNNLQDSQTTALIKGKNSYIESLNAGDAKNVAESTAKQATADYYATKQRNLVAEWNAQASEFMYLHQQLNNETGIQGINISKKDDGDGDGRGVVRNNGYLTAEVKNTVIDLDDPDSAQFRGTTQTTVTLADGSTANVTALKFFVERDYTAGSEYDSTTVTITPVSGNTTVKASTSGGGSAKYTVTALGVKPPDSNYDRIKDGMAFWKYSARWTEIETQNTNAQGELDTLVNNTYSEYQSGEINNSDLVDPYTLSSGYSAGDSFQSFAAAQLTMLGTNSPETLDTTGAFEITTASNKTYEGVLFSKENPSTGQFEANTTYNPAKIGGTQYVVTSDRTVELTENFTVGNITGSDGERVQNATIEKTTYKTANVTELKQLYEDLAYRRAQIEARKQALENGGAGGLLGGSTSGMIVLLLAAAGFAAYAGGRDD